MLVETFSSRQHEKIAEHKVLRNKYHQRLRDILSNLEIFSSDQKQLGTFDLSSVEKLKIID